MLNLIIKTIQHNEQRYNTVGDWKDGEVRVSDLGNDNYEFLIGLHELIEMWLCKENGVAEIDVTSFDLAFVGVGEPGDDIKAPYYLEHQFASGIERLVAQQLGVDWLMYEARCGGIICS